MPQIDADPQVIGDRAYAKWPDIITAIAHAHIEGLKKGGALPVIKHLPGHGRSLCDSHHDLPRVGAKKRDLQSCDFEPFRSLRDEKMGMTAHIVYEAYDAERPATLSPVIVNEVIRGEIGFDGLLFTDDLKMKALGGAIPERIAGAYDAGCDVALACNFTMDEKKQSAGALRDLAGRSAERAKAAMADLQAPERGDTSEAYERLNALIKPALA